MCRAECRCACDSDLGFCIFLFTFVLIPDIILKCHLIKIFSIGAALWISHAISVEHFFHALEQETASGDMAALAERFSASFMAASPNGAKVAQRSVFVESMPARKQLFDKLGCNLRAWFRLRQPHWTPATRWPRRAGSSHFVREGQEQQDIFAESTYIVDTGAEPFQIILYLTSQDLPKVLAERGILPNE